MTDHTSAPWWRAFFESADSLILSNFPDAEETAFEVEALVRLVPLRESDRIADICCGMGRHLLPLTARGFDLVGLDRSGMMLALAREAARQARISPRLVQGEAQALPFADASFDVVLNLFNSFGYLATVTDDMAVLRETARCLKPGGRFFLDTRNKKYQILYAPYNQPLVLPDRRRLTMRCKYERETNCLVSLWYERDSEHLVHTAAIRLYAPRELDEMLESVGFRVLQRFGNYGGATFEGWERQLLILCEKV
jgi:ubiquinone/menaquinone biosynthesis C-methylase UbiE